MKQDRIYFAFPCKSAEPAKLLVLVININTLQVTFKNQEDIQNCLRCCLAEAEILNFAGDHFWTLSIAIRNYFSACDSYLLPQADSIQYSYCRPGKCWWGKPVSVFPCVMGECRCYIFSSLASCSSQTSALLFA